MQHKATIHGSENNFLTSLNLNSPQLEAVQTLDGALLVLAGAGTGKTKVVTCRIANIIQNSLCEPENILAVTFTNKAANEMRSRLQTMVSSASEMWIGTFHSICSRILRQHAKKVDLSQSFSILDESEQRQVVKDILSDIGFDSKEFTPAFFLNRISLIKNSLDQELAIEKSSYRQFNIKDIFNKYQQKLLSLDSVDFDDLLILTIRLFLQNSEVTEAYQDRFKYITVDEYQDTNAVQHKLVKILSLKHQNICCVGDDDQSIYSWRGANVSHILDFSKDFPSAKVIKLEQNYRSTGNILKAASSVISQNNNRKNKTLWTNDGEGSKVHLVIVDGERDEAKQIANIITKSSDYGNYSKIAVLVRAIYQTRAIEEALLSCAIPYKIIGGPKFYERKEIKDTVAYLRLLISDQDEFAFERVLNAPKRGIGATSLQKIKAFASRHKIPILSAVEALVCEQSQQGFQGESDEHDSRECEYQSSFLGELSGLSNTQASSASQLGTKRSAPIAQKSEKFSGKTAFALRSLLSSIYKWRDMFADAGCTLHGITQVILDESGYMLSLKNEDTEESLSRVENIKEFVHTISEFASLTDLLEHIALVNDADAISQDNNYVNIMTMHAAKGLEFETVIIPGMEEEVFPHKRSIEEGSKESIEEERRLAYVGITRARKNLYLTQCKNRNLFGKYQHGIQSRFVKEIDKNCLQIKDASTIVNFRQSNQSFDKSMSDMFFKKPDYQPQKKLSSLEIKEGGKVTHMKFGIGTVICLSGLFADVKFADGSVKSIRVDFLKAC